MEEDGKDRILGLQAVLEVESDENPVQPSYLEATRMFKPLKTRNLESTPSVQCLSEV